MVILMNPGGISTSKFVKLKLHLFLLPVRQIVWSAVNNIHSFSLFNLTLPPLLSIMPSPTSPRIAAIVRRCFWSTDLPSSTSNSRTISSRNRHAPPSKILRISFLVFSFQVTLSSNVSFRPFILFPTHSLSYELRTANMSCYFLQIYSSTIHLLLLPARQILRAKQLSARFRYMIRNCLSSDCRLINRNSHQISANS